MLSPLLSPQVKALKIYGVIKARQSRMGPALVAMPFCACLQHTAEPAPRMPRPSLIAHLKGSSLGRGLFFFGGGYSQS